MGKNRKKWEEEDTRFFGDFTFCKIQLKFFKFEIKKFKYQKTVKKLKKLIETKLARVHLLPPLINIFYCHKFAENNFHFISFNL